MPPDAPVSFGYRDVAPAEKTQLVGEVSAQRGDQRALPGADGSRHPQPQRPALLGRFCLVHEVLLDGEPAQPHPDGAAGTDCASLLNVGQVGLDATSG